MKFYVSLVNDLRGCYLEFEAESHLAVEQYLEREYLARTHGRVEFCECGRDISSRDKTTWTLPWCAIYEQIPSIEENPIIIKSQCGTLYEHTEFAA